MEEIMRPFMTSLLVAVLSVSTFASYDYTITGGYTGILTLDSKSLLMTGGGINSLTASGSSILDIKNTSSLAVLSGGIWTLDLWGSSQLELSGGQVNSLKIHGSATAVLSGGLINKIYSYQSTTVPNYMQHIEMVVKDHMLTGNILTGHWGDNSTFNIQLMNQSGYALVIDNIKFTIPEPTTLLLLAVGGLLLRRKKS
jgi:hypothetical protein